MGMNENFSERIEKALNDIENVQSLFKLRYGEECVADKEIEEVLKIAKAEHEELEQYRAIGAPEQIKSNMEELKRWHSSVLNDKIKNPFANTSTLICANCAHKDEYIEELEAEIEEYKSIGTPEECRAAVEKQRAKKPHSICREKTEMLRIGRCPTCNCIMGEDTIYCDDCGQLIDWSDVND